MGFFEGLYDFMKSEKEDPRLQHAREILEGKHPNDYYDSWRRGSVRQEPETSPRK